MTTLNVTPGQSLQGEVILPGDKSLSHRAALFGALADGESRFTNFLVAGVTRAMLEALSELGVRWQLEGNDLTIQGGSLEAATGPLHFNCGNSATTLRLLAGALAALDLPAVLDGSPGLRRRPMDRIVEPLQQMGVNIRSQDGHAPLQITPAGRPLAPLVYTLAVASAQVKSCLLLAALAAPGETVLSEPGPSRDHTERMLRAMGVSVKNAGNTIHMIPPVPWRLEPLEMRLPCDISAAAFLIVATLITPGSLLTLRGVGLNPTRTGLLDALARMGADISIQNFIETGGEPAGDLVVRSSQLNGTEVAGDEVVRMIDEFPALAAAALFATSPTHVRGAEELRYKESDRIGALAGELRRLGAMVDEHPDGFTIQGGGLPAWPMPRRVQSCGDHRLAMSLAVAGLAAPGPVWVEHAEVISESFPEFVPTLAACGANVVQAA